MIHPHTFSIEHIRAIQKQSRRDPALIERVIFAFGLLEAIARTGLPFIFKGGSALMLLMDKPRRFSTDIDIVVRPGIALENYLETAAVIWPFIKKTEQIRQTVSAIEKRHFKFSYVSPLTGKDLTILLDVLFEESHYRTTVIKKIENELLLIDEDKPAVSVCLPNANGILADKLTAFAPHTTGICFNEDKELEIIKQLYDIAALMEYMDDFAEVKDTYRDMVRTELAYRSLSASPDDVLKDTIHTAACVAGRGLLHKEEYLLLRRGISRISNHIYSESFNGEVAVQRACMVMLLAACVLTNQEGLPAIKDDNHYLSINLPAGKFSGLSHIKKTDMLAYKYLVEAISILN